MSHALSQRARRALQRAESYILNTCQEDAGVRDPDPDGVIDGRHYGSEAAAVIREIRAALAPARNARR